LIKNISFTGSRKRKRKLGDQIQDAVTNKKFLMGNFRLTNLWNLCPDNMEACSAPERDFLPGLDEYFLEAIEQLNPENQIEEDYK
jgi:THO complex subunit 1